MRLRHNSGELWALVEERDAVVRQVDLAGYYPANAEERRYQYADSIANSP